MRIALQIFAVVLLTPIQLAVCVVVFGANKDALPVWFVQSASPWLLMLVLIVPLITAICSQPLAKGVSRLLAWAAGVIVAILTFALLAPGASMLARNGMIEMLSNQRMEQAAWASAYLLALSLAPAIIAFLATWKMLKRAAELNATDVASTQNVSEQIPQVRKNDRQGLVRLGVVIALVWIGIAAWIAHENRIEAVSGLAQQGCFRIRSAIRTLGNVFECFNSGLRYDDLVPLERTILHFSILAGTPIIGLFLVWALGRWVLLGFKR